MTATTSNRRSEPTGTAGTKSRSITLIVAILAFLSLGLPDGALGVAWPSIRTSFGLSLSQLGTLLTASMLGYLFASALSGRIVQAIGVGHLLTLSTALMAASAAGYALSPGWWSMVGCAVGAGMGSGAIDAGLNAYAAHHFSPRATNWMHATFGFGATTGPLLMTALIARGSSWRWGYAVIAGLMTALAVAFLATHRVWRDDGEPAADGAAAPDAASAEPHAGAAELMHPLRRPRVWVGIALFFVYTGLEFSTGQWAYSVLTQSRGVRPAIAGTAVGLFWGSLTAGRIVLGGLTTWVSHTLILRCAVVGAPFAALCIASRGHYAINIAGLMLMGFTLAPIFPLMISVTPQRVGTRDASHAVGYQIAAAALGGAGLPALAGIVAKSHGLEVIGPYLVAVAVMFLVLHEIVLRLAPSDASRAA
jgi:fucose permease